MALFRVTNATVGAPSMTGQSGSLTAILDFVLVTTAGWTKEFTATNKGVYRAPAGNRNYLRVDDTYGAYALVQSYEAMTTVDAGTNPCPTVAQKATGLHWPKSSSSDATIRPWTCVVANGMMYLWIGTDGTVASEISNYALLHAFGDFLSYKGGDTFNTVICGSAAAGVSDSSTYTIGTSTAVTNGVYIQRPHTQIGAAINGGRSGNASMAAGSGFFGSAGSTYPNPIDGGLHMSPVFLGEGNSNGLRGYFPGLWIPMHAVPLAHHDTFSGAGAFAGKTFEAFKFGPNYECFIETSDTWS